MTKKQELAKIDEYAVMKHEPKDLMLLLEENMGGAGIDASSLPTVPTPSGGSLAWSVPSITGEEAVTDLQGVVLAQADKRSYWQASFDDQGGGVPPDCSSADGKTGTGFIEGQTEADTESGRICKECPMSQWGSGKNNSKACAERRLLFLLRPDEMLPIVVDLAPTSVVVIRDFMFGLTSKNISCTRAVVGLTLSAQMNKQGKKYSVVEPRLIEALTGDTAERMKAVADAMRPYLS